MSAIAAAASLLLSLPGSTGCAHEWPRPEGLPSNEGSYPSNARWLVGRSVSSEGLLLLDDAGGELSFTIVSADDRGESYFVVPDAPLAPGVVRLRPATGAEVAYEIAAEPDTTGPLAPLAEEDESAAAGECCTVAGCLVQLGRASDPGHEQPPWLQVDVQGGAGAYRLLLHEVPRTKLLLAEELGCGSSAFGEAVELTFTAIDRAGNASPSPTRLSTTFRRVDPIPGDGSVRPDDEAEGCSVAGSSRGGTSAGALLLALLLALLRRRR